MLYPCDNVLFKANICDCILLLSGASIPMKWASVPPNDGDTNVYDLFSVFALYLLFFYIFCEFMWSFRCLKCTGIKAVLGWLNSSRFSRGGAVEGNVIKVLEYLIQLFLLSVFLMLKTSFDGHSREIAIKVHNPLVKPGWSPIDQRNVKPGYCG